MKQNTRKHTRTPVKTWWNNGFFKKPYSIILCLTIVLSIFSGCNGRMSEETSSGPIKANKTNGKHITVLVEEGSAAFTAAQSTAEAFADQHGYEVIIDAVSYDNLFDRISSGTSAYDVVSIDDRHLWELVPKLCTLDDIIDDGIKNDFLPGTVKGATFEEGLYAFPMFSSCKVLLYRKDLFENEENKIAFFDSYDYDLKPPTTWTEYLNCAEFFTKDDMYGTSVAGFSDSDSLSCWLDFAAQAGASPLVINGSKVHITDKAYAESLNFIKKLCNKGWAAQDALSVSLSQAQKLFTSGKTAMQLTWAENYTSAAQALGDDKVGVSTMLGSSAGIGSVTDTWYQAIPESSKKQDIAKKYLQFMLEHNNEYMETSSRLAARTCVLEQYINKEGYEHVRPMLDTFEAKQTQSLPYGEDWDEIEAKLIECFQTALKGDSTKDTLNQTKGEIIAIISD